jgi:hypothetical protein
MWTKYFKVVKVRPGRIITPSHGELDFSRPNIPVEICKELFEADFPYLEITEAGKRELYGEEGEDCFAPLAMTEEFKGEDPVFEPLPPAEDNPEEMKVSEPIVTSKKKSNKKKL